MTAKLRVLLVDDDEVDREIVKRAFRRTRLTPEIVEAEAAEHALAAVDAAGDGFHVGLFDLRLPGLDGLELLTEMRERGVDLPVIFLTGQGNEETAVELMKSGAADYLSKATLTPERLERSITHVLRLTATERARREAERALRESEANFRRLTENLPDHVARFDAAGRFVYVNAPIPWLAADVPALLGHTLDELGADAPAEILSQLEAGLRAALAGEAGQITVYAPLRAEADDDPLVELADEDEVDDDALDDDDEWVEVPHWVEVRFVPEVPPGGGPRTVLAIARDVTAEVARREEEHQRAEIERQLIGIVSHDLRNPIGAVLMSSSVLSKKLAASEVDQAVHRALDVLAKSSHRAQRMVSDILDFTKARLGGGIPVSLARVDIAATVAELVGEMRATHPRRTIALHSGGEVRGTFDGDRVAQAVSNLIGNAIAYSHPDEVVTIAVEARYGEVIIAVTNRGPTIPEEVLPRLFKPFQRGEAQPGDKNVSRSVGLGLFIVERIVQAHRGRIEVESSNGVTVFRMVLPRRRPSGRMRALTRPPR